jgi:hypothetical protein
MEESIAEMTTLRQVKAEKAICSDGVSAALHSVPWQGSACTQSALIFLVLGGLGRGIFSFLICSQHVPFTFPMGSHQVLNIFHKFPMCSSRVFPIAIHFNPIYFAQSPPLLTYIDGPHA